MSVTIFSLCHSFSEPGCSTPSGDLTERYICQSVNDEAYKYLVAHGGAPISVSHDALADRIRGINEMVHMIPSIDAAIETHCNWVKEKSKSGFFSIAHHDSVRSVALAEQINVQLELINRSNLGVCKVNGRKRWIGTPREYKGKRLGFIEDTICPSIIIELGYLSNPWEASWLSRLQNRVRMGEAIAKGLIRWRSINR